jgi:hypothetical protein
VPSSRFRSVNPCPAGRAAGPKCAPTNSRLVTGLRPGSAVISSDGPAMNASGCSVKSSSARLWSKSLGNRTGFLPPTSAVARSGVTTPTPWLSAS